jgi:PAS domain S-box-containing protein
MWGMRLIPAFPPTNRLLLRTVWPFVLAVCLLSASMVVSFNFLSSVRAYVGGESLWSKGQKQALISLLHYTETQSEEDYQAFIQGIGVPLGDRQARLALERPVPDLEAARQGFLQGGNHPRDIPGMIRLYRYFHDTRLMQESVRAWRQGDEQILRLRELGESLRRRASSGPLSDLEETAFQERLHHLDRAVTPLETAFSNAIARVSRQLTVLLSAALGGLSVLLLALGLWLSRRLAIQQVLAVQAMAQEYEKNLVFLHSAGDGIHILDGAGNVREASDSFCAMLGYSRDEVIGMHVARWDAGFRRDDIPEKLGQLFDDKAASQFETLHRRRDGSLFEVEINSRPIMLEGNRYLFCSSRDITERKRSEDRLRKSEARFRSLFESSRDAILVQDGPIFIDCNLAALHLVGATHRDQVVGHSPAEFSLASPADPRPAATRAGEKIQAAMDGAPQMFEWPTRRLDGVEITLEVQLSRMEVGGRPYIQSICRDITARKRAEEELRQHRDELERKVEQRAGELYDIQFAMDKVGIGITWVDFKTGRFTYCNRSAAELLGYSVDEMLQMSVPDIDPNFSVEAFSQTGKEVKRQGHLQFETSQRAKDGRPVPVELAIYFHPAAGGGDPRFIVFQTDISQRKKAQQVLVQAKEAAEAANRAKSAFLANMSHEIRTPMNAITGMAHLMRSHGLEPEQVKRLDKITVAGQHLLETINAILDLSKIEAGQFVLEQKPLSLQAVVDNVQAMVRPQAEQKGLQFRVEMGVVPAGVGGDATRLQQALLNYAANAVKFTPQGGITVRVEQLEEDEHSVLLRFEVQDTGVGIAVDTVPRVFNAFEQADNSITRNYGGTGLGLAITRNIARLMGGEAGVQSTLGEGSRFWFTCRLQRLRPASAAPAVPSAEDAEAVLTRDFAGTRVLLVEDDPINSEVAGYLLEEIAFDVDTAENGAKAAYLAETNEYALILMDMQMPVMGGLEATRLIRRNGRCTTAPILAMTANAFAEDKAACFAAGMNGFLSKPIDPHQLYDALLKFLSSPNFQEG